jgi:uncharacterized protein YcgL (UPF0745 family)
MTVVNIFKKKLRSAISIIVPDNALVPEAIENEFGPLKLWKKVTLDRHGKSMFGVDQASLLSDLERQGYAVHRLEVKSSATLGKVPTRQ